MKVYFWYAERIEKSPIHLHLNQASGLVTADTAQRAFEYACTEAREDLGNTKQFTIKQFNIQEGS
jgi:hypothetical protein